MPESDKSLELFLGAIDIPPEEAENDEKAVTDHIERSEYLYAAEDIINHIGQDEFKEMFFVSFDVLRTISLDRLRRTAEQILDKIEEVYDFVFPQKIDLSTRDQINYFFEFVRFLEFDNFHFLTVVWKFLSKNLMTINIEDFCRSNTEKIIKEVEEQLDSHPQNELITIFLRTYYKDKFIEWFVRESIKNKVHITIELNSESEG